MLVSYHYAMMRSKMISRAPALIVAILAANAMSVPSRAQVAPPESETPPEMAPGAPTTPDDLTEARPNDHAAELDRLFEQLRSAEGDNWVLVQNRIWALWSRSGSPSMDLLLARATKAMQARNLDLALDFLDDLVRLDPDFAEAWNKRATVHFMKENYAQSIADIRQTLAHEPRHFGALAGLGMILERMGDKEGAYRAYQRALEVHPHLVAPREAIERLRPDVEGRKL